MFIPKTNLIFLENSIAAFLGFLLGLALLMPLDSLLGSQCLLHLFIHYPSINHLFLSLSLILAGDTFLL